MNFTTPLPCDIACRLTVQAHNWRCLRCTFNTGKGISEAESRCTQVRSPGLFVLRGGQAGELPCRSLHMHQWHPAVCRSPDSANARLMTGT